MVLALAAATALVMWPVGPLPGRSWGFIALGLWVGAWILARGDDLSECGKPFFWRRAGFESTAGTTAESCGASLRTAPG